jgi:hypothetical protein
MCNIRSPLDEQYKLPVTVFLGYVLCLSLSQILPTLQHIYDLHEQCPMTIHDQALNVPMSFKVINCSDGHQCYRLNQSETSPWDLVLEQAVDVLECQQRLWGPDVFRPFLPEAFRFGCCPHCSEQMCPIHLIMTPLTVSLLPTILCLNRGSEISCMDNEEELPLCKAGFPGILQERQLEITLSWQVWVS